MDFLGYVCIRVDRNKPLSDTPEVCLDLATVPATDTLGGLWLMGDRFVFKPHREVIPVAECVS